MARLTQLPCRSKHPDALEHGQSWRDRWWSLFVTTMRLRPLLLIRACRPAWTWLQATHNRSEPKARLNPAMPT